MKTPHRPASPTHIEILESRIAPAAVTLNFFDKDHNAISVISTKGTKAQLETAVGVAEGATAQDVLAFNFGAPFKGANITLTAGLTATDAIFTRVASIDADGVDLGKVTIDGELDRIDAGDGNSATAGLVALTVGSFGNGDAFDSVVVGALTALTVNGDFNGAYLKVRGSDSNNPTPPAHKTDMQGKIGTLFIGGDLIGTARENGGSIFTTGDIGKITVVGSIVGFRAATQPQDAPTDQDFNGSIFAGGVVTSLTIGTDAADGNLIGGDGSGSGQVAAAAINTVIVKGSLQGGLGTESGAIGVAATLGSVQITKDIVGGDGLRSGTLLSRSSIASVKVGGNIQGGDGENSGAIGTNGNIGTVIVTGDVVGGAGESSGQIVTKGTIKSVTVRNLIGGSEFESGAIGSLKGLGTINVTGNIIAGSGDRSGIICTIDGGEGAVPAPIASVTVGGSISGILPLPGRPDALPDGGAVPVAGRSSGAILCSGNLGPVVVAGDIIGGDGAESGQIVGQSNITSVTIGGILKGGTRDYTGSVFAGGNMGPVKIGDPNFHGNGKDGFIGTGIIGGDGFQSGGVYAGQLTKIDVFGDVQGSTGEESGSIVTEDRGTGGKMGAVYIRGDVIGGDPSLTDLPIGSLAQRSGSIISVGAIASVTIGGGAETNSSLIGGGGSESGGIASLGDIGPISIAGNLEGGDGSDSGVIVSGGKIAKVEILGSLLGGDGSFSGTIRTEIATRLVGSSVPLGGDIGPVFIGKSLIGSTGPSTANDSGAIISAGKIVSVTIGDPNDSDTESGNVRGGNSLRSGAITSAGDMGPVKIKGSLIGGSGDESGKITSGGKLASLTLGSAAISGSIVGGSGDYDTTVESGDQLGQVYAAGAIGAVNISGNIDGNSLDGGDYAAQIRGLSIASVTVGGSIDGGEGDHSGGVYATSLNIGKVTVGDSIRGGFGNNSGFVAAEGNISSVTIGNSLAGGPGSGSGYVAAGDTLGSFASSFVSGGGSVSRPRISAGKMISSVTVAQSIFNADILSGYGTSGFAINPDAQIGTVRIGVGTGEVTPGHMEGTNIVAGISAGTDGFFGTFDDTVIFGAGSASIHSKIASVIVQGGISSTSTPSDTYGIVAEQVVSVKVGGSALPLTGGALNDAYQPTGSGSDTFYGELASVGGF